MFCSQERPWSSAHEYNQSCFEPLETHQKPIEAQDVHIPGSSGQQEAAGGENAGKVSAPVACMGVVPSVGGGGSACCC